MSTTAAKMQVPLLDLKQQHAALREELGAALGRVLDSQQFILGEDVRLLEAELARYTGAGHAGLRVVRLLEAAQASIEDGGRWIKL